jgi:hypothetical protein
MKEHQFQAIVGAGKNKYPQKPCRVWAAHRKRKDTRYICNKCKVPLHKGDCFTRYHTRMKVSFQISSRLVIIVVCILKNTGENNAAHRGGPENWYLAINVLIRVAYIALTYTWFPRPFLPFRISDETFVWLYYRFHACCLPTLSKAHQHTQRCSAPTTAGNYDWSSWFQCPRCILRKRKPDVYSQCLQIFLWIAFNSMK